MVITSGVQDPYEDISEAQAIKEGLMALGVEEERIIIDDQSTSTIENIEYAMELMPEVPGTVILCTTNYHVFRAVKTAEEAGLEAVGLAAPVPESVKGELYLREYASIAHHTLLRDIRLFF